jgi:predicted MFS family arabinose efflux permease
MMGSRMLAPIRRLNPFKTPDARRLALLFGIVYFAQGMWYLPNQTITIVLKERGLSAGQVADFFLITIIPWLIKPVYGLLSDFVPLFGRRRLSYFLITSSLAAFAGLILAAGDTIAVGPIRTLDLPGVKFTLVPGVGLFTLMALGLAFTDVLTDAMMVENGRPRGLTGAFQSVQWACVTVASVAVGELGGSLAETHSLRAAFLIAACFPLVSLFMARTFIHEPVARRDKAAFLETWRAIWAALGHREIWIVAGFIFFFWFSPSFGPAFLYYQTDTLKFSQQFIGRLAAVGALAGVIGAVVYAPLSRRVPLKRIINISIGFGAIGTLAYLVYRDAVSAVLITVVFGAVSMIMQLAFLDLAAKACPPHVEATFFALLMSVFNLGVQLAENVGARLYDRVGYSWLVVIGAAMTALTWVLVPLVRIDRIEAKARAEATTALEATPAS